MSQQCILVVMKANSILKLHKRTTSRWRERENPSHLLSTDEAYMERWVQFWAFQNSNDTNIQERVQRQDTQMIRGVELLSYEKR